MGRSTWRRVSGTQLFLTFKKNLVPDFFLSSALRLIPVKRGRSWSTSYGTRFSVMSLAASSAMPIFWCLLLLDFSACCSPSKPLYLKGNSSVCPTGFPAFPVMLQLFGEGIFLSCPERFRVTTGLVRKPGAICHPKVREVLPTAGEHALECLSDAV